jgi:hypothetical protein
MTKLAKLVFLASLLAGIPAYADKTASEVEAV